MAKNRLPTPEEISKRIAELEAIIAAGVARSDPANEELAKLLAEHEPKREAPRRDRTEPEQTISKHNPDVDWLNNFGKHGLGVCEVCIAGKWRILQWESSPIPEFRGQRERVISTIEDFEWGYRDRHSWVRVNVFDQNGNETGESKLVKRKLAPLWLDHSDHNKYWGIRFMPFTDDVSYGHDLNLWTGFSFKPIAGDWSLFKAHLHDNVCDGVREHYDYLIRWMACIVQHKARSEVCVLLRSDEEGTGKGETARHFGKLFGPHAMQLTNSEHIIGKFNPHLENLLFLNADEALFSGDPRHRNALWSRISEPTIQIEHKGFTMYDAPNYLNIMITTNAKHAVRVGATARRIFALNVGTKQMQNNVYFDAINDQMKTGGYAAMLHDLQTMDLTGFEVRKIPKTAALREQQAYSRSGVDAIVEEVCNMGRVPHAHWRQTDVTVCSDTADRDGFDAWIGRSTDRDLRNMHPTAVKRALHDQWGCEHTQQFRDGAGRVYGFQWLPLAELRERFEAKHGPQEWLNDTATEWPQPDGAEIDADRDRLREAQERAKAARQGVLTLRQQAHVNRQARVADRCNGSGPIDLEPRASDLEPGTGGAS